MPVGTQGAVKGLLPETLAEIGSGILLANTYHLALRPGAEVVRDLGGLHALMAWNGPILTDSGGFQAMSLEENAKIDDRGVRFRSHLDGSALDLTPETAMHIQQLLGADIAMCLDHCPRLPATRAAVEEAVERTTLWAKRCREAACKPDQAVFGIVQGGVYADLRERSASAIVALDFDGYAIGGVSVGEGPEDMRSAVAHAIPHLPREKARYLMGVGKPIDLIDSIALGVDLFDCVLPTRNGRNAHCFTARGVVRLRNAVYKTDDRPIEPGCDCPACRRFSRGAIRHFFLANEMSGPILASVHNLAYLHRLMRQAREAISAGWYVQWRLESLAVEDGSGLD